MTDTALAAAPPAAGVPTTSTRPPPVLPNLLRAEWAKLGSVRSSYWSVGLAVLAMIGYGAINSASHGGAHADVVNPISTSLSGVLLAQLAIGVLGVLVISSEYSTGMIRCTFAAAPQRRSVILAKTGVFAALAFAVGTVASVIAFLTGQAIMSAHGVDLTSPGALRSVIGIGLYLSLLGVLAVALGTVIRRSIGAIAALVGLLLVLPGLLLTLPASLQDSVVKFLPANAGQAIFTTGADSSTLPPWAGLAVFAAYAAAALTIGLVLVRRRDA
jgi:ABC-type transport system involved in multi-copper enzyme maturation permease subunit